MTTNKNFADRRKAMGISQGRIAKRTGISQSAISQYEIGNLGLRPQQIARLEDALRQELAQVARDVMQVAKQYGALV